MSSDISHELQVVQDQITPARRAVVQSVRTYFPDAVSKLASEPQYKDAVADAVVLINQAFKLETSIIQIAIMATVLMDAGVTIDQLRMVTRDILRDPAFAEKARYKAPVTATDFLERMSRIDPNWKIKQQLNNGENA